MCAIAALAFRCGGASGRERRDRDFEEGLDQAKTR
jgi:hypothetical protein